MKCLRRIQSLNNVQRVVLSVSVPTVVLLLLYPLSRRESMRVNMFGKLDEMSYAVYLRDEPWFWAACVAGVAIWLMMVWSGRGWSSSVPEAVQLDDAAGEAAPRS
jgi:Mn2+/Fe2+ NRAMP family transporter